MQSAIYAPMKEIMGVQAHKIQICGRKYLNPFIQMQKEWEWMKPSCHHGPTRTCIQNKNKEEPIKEIMKELPLEAEGPNQIHQVFIFSN